MAEPRREGLKQALLLAFIALNVILILFVWADNLIDQPGDQGFVRSTRGPAAVPTAATPEPQPTPTPLRSAPAGAPTDTPLPYRDSGDIGMLPPFDRPARAGA